MERHRGRQAGTATLIPLQDLRILGVLDAVLLSNGAHRHEVEGEDLEVQLVQAPRAKVRVVRRHARLAQALRCAGTSTIKARRGGSARERGPRRRGKAGPHLVVVRGPHALAPRDLCVPSEVLDHEAAAHDGRQADGSPQRDNLERKNGGAGSDTAATEATAPHDLLAALRHSRAASAQDRLDGGTAHRMVVPELHDGDALGDLTPVLDSILPTCQDREVASSARAYDSLCERAAQALTHDCCNECSQ